MGLCFGPETKRIPGPPPRAEDERWIGPALRPEGRYRPCGRGPKQQTLGARRIFFWGGWVLAGKRSASPNPATASRGSVESRWVQRGPAGHKVSIYISMRIRPGVWASSSTLLFKIDLKSNGSVVPPAIQQTCYSSAQLRFVLAVV